MDVLPLNFKVLQFCGIWYEYPNRWWPIKMVYKVFILFMLFSLTISQIIKLMLSIKNLHELTECLFLSMTFLTCCFKIINFMYREKSLQQLLNCYRVDIFQPRTTSEQQLISKYQSLISTFFIFYVNMALLAAISMSLMPLIKSASNETLLPIKTYQPYSTEDLTLYLITYVYQMLCFIFGILINVSMDMLFCGFIILTCCQLDLCCQRIAVNKSSTLVAKSTSEYIMHYVSIKDTVDNVQSHFIVVVMLLIFFNLIVFCTSLFQLPQLNMLSYEFFTTVVYLLGILFQVFTYCWFGNQLELKSRSVSDAIYMCDWPNLTAKQRKNLLLTMFISQNGLTISFHGQCDLSVDTFVWILRTSYATFNVLRENYSK